MSDPLRVLVADDHPVFRSGIRAQLELTDAVALIGEVATGSECVSAAAALKPDVVVMDLHMPDLNGIDATRRILAASPEVRVLVLTMFDDNDSVFAAVRAGARGYLLKGATGAEIVRAIESVGNGEAIFGPAIASRIASLFASPPHPKESFPSLTDREREVLELIAAGWSNQQIAKHFVLSLKTVRNHVSNIFAKLEVADRHDAMERAKAAGLGRSR